MKSWDKHLYLDNAATTPLSAETKAYLCTLLDLYGNPSSQHTLGQRARQLLTQSREAVARFIGAEPEDIYFTPSGSASNTLAIKGLANPKGYAPFYSPTAHKSMRKACESCSPHTPLQVNGVGEINLHHLETSLAGQGACKPLVCVEAANSEIGAINDLQAIGTIVQNKGGVLVADATGSIPSMPVDIRILQKNVDLLTFSGHKLGALKGVGVLWKKKSIKLTPLIYGSQEQGLVGGTENLLGIASLGKALQNYEYASVTPQNREYVYSYLISRIPHCYLVGPSKRRLPHNLYMCFQGVEGEALALLLDLYGIQVSTGSACNSRDLQASPVLTAIGMNKRDLHSCLRITFSGKETKEELDYLCHTLKQCVSSLRA